MIVQQNSSKLFNYKINIKNSSFFCFKHLKLKLQSRLSNHYKFKLKTNVFKLIYCDLVVEKLLLLLRINV